MPPEARRNSGGSGGHVIGSLPDPVELVSPGPSTLDLLHSPVPQGPAMRRVNVPLLIAIALLLIGGVAGTYVLHRFQVRRNAEDMARQARRQIDEGNDDEAIRLLSRYVALRPDDTPRQREYAELLLRRVDAGKATPRVVGATVAALEVAVRKAPDADDLREKLANLLARIGDADSIRSANEHLAMIRQRRPDGEANDDTRRVDLMFAATAAQMGQFDDAEEVLAALTGFDRRTKQFDPAFQPAPGHPESFAALAEILERHRRDPKTAERIIDRMMEFAPDEVSTWKILATWRMGHKQAEAAIEAAEKARTLAPDDQDVALLELRLAIVGNRLDRAAEILAGPLGDVTDSADVFAAKAYLARAKGDIDSLISILRDAVAAFPSNPAFRADLLLGLSDGKRFEELRPLISESQPLLGKDAVPVLWAEAVVAMSEQRWFEAMKLWDRVRPQVAADATMTRRVDLFMSTCHGGLGQRDQANDARKRAFADAPESLGAKFTEMVSLDLAQRWQEALVIAEELAAQTPPDKLDSNPLLLKTLLRLRIRDRLSRNADRRDWTKVDTLADTIAAKPDADPIEIGLMKIDILSAKDKLDEARAASDALIADHPESPAIFAQSLLLLVAAGQVDDARARLTNAKESIRDTPEVLEAEARLAATAPSSEAGEWLTDLEARMGRVTGPASDRCARQLIAIHVGRGHVSDAERIAGTLLARRPADLAVRQVVLELAAERDAVEEVARQTAEIVRVAGPTSSTAKLATAASKIVAIRAKRQGMQAADSPSAALSAEDLASLAEARDLLTVAGAERASWSEVPRMQGAIAELQGDPSGAIGHLRRAVELGETLPFARRRLAILLTAAGRLDEAAPVIASLGDAGGPVIDRIRAQVLATAGRTDVALQIGASLTPEDCHDVQQLMWYSRLLASCGRPEEAEQVGRRATEAAPDSEAAWLSLLRLQTSAGAGERVAETSRQALAVLEGDARERFQMAADEAVGDPEATERAAKEAVEQSPDDLVAARRLVDLLMRRNRPAEAQKELRRIIALESVQGSPTVFWARRALASLLAASPRYIDLQEALAVLGKNVDEQGLQYLDDTALSISLLMNRNDPASWRQAQTLFESLAKRRPLTIDERISQARIQSLVGNRPKAREELRAIASSANASTAVLGTIIELFINEQDFAEARAWLRRLQESAPDLQATIRLEAKLALAEGDRDRAGRVVAKLFDDEPLSAQNAPRQLSAARIAAELGFPEAADKVLESYATMSPEGVAAQAMSLGRQHRTTEAIEMIETVRGKVSVAMFLEALAVILRHAEAASDPAIDERVAGWIEAARRENPGSYETLLQATIAKEALGHTAEAEEDYRQLLASGGLGDVQSGIVAANLAWILARSETADQALELVDKAILELGPLPDILDTRALIRLAKGQTILALEDMNDAVLSPSPLKLLHMAAIQAEISDLPGARASFARAKALGLGQERLSPDDAARLERVESFLASADGKS